MIAEKSEKAVSPVVGIAVLVAIAVVISALVFATTSGFMTEQQAPSAGANVNIASESVIEVQLDSVQNADTVYVQSPLGTRYELEEVGDTVEILNIGNQQKPVVIAEKNGKENVVQGITPRSFDADYVVANDGSGSHESIQAAIDEASGNETIVVKKGEYSEAITVNEQTRLIAEDGTNLNNSVDVSGNSSTISNLNITGTTTVGGDSVYLAGNSFSSEPNISGNDVTISENTTDLLNTNSTDTGNSNETIENTACGNPEERALASYNNWSSELAITVDNPNDTCLNDYQFKMEIEHKAGMSDDFSDLRFVQRISGEDKKLSYWIENKTNGESATVWVEVAYVPPSGETTIDMLYGNSDAESKSNGDSTFIVFDDFNRSSIGSNYTFDYTSGGGQAYISNGVAVLEADHSTYWSGQRWSLTYTGGKIAPNYEIHTMYHTLSSSNSQDQNQSIRSHVESSEPRSNSSAIYRNRYLSRGNVTISNSYSGNYNRTSTPVDSSKWTSASIEVTTDHLSLFEQDSAGQNNTLSLNDVQVPDKEQYPFAMRTYSGYHGDSNLWVDYWFVTEQSNKDVQVTING